MSNVRALEELPELLSRASYDVFDSYLANAGEKVVGTRAAAVTNVEQEFADAIERGDLNTVKRILEEKPAGFDINAKIGPKGETALQLVASSDLRNDDWIRIATLLVEAGADGTLLTAEGKSAYQIADQRAATATDPFQVQLFRKMAQVLRQDLNADLSQAVTGMNKDGQKLYAVDNAWADRLLAAGADANSPMFEAIYAGDVEKLKAVLANLPKGADVNALDGRGEPPLILALFRQIGGRENNDILKVLLADPRSDLTVKSKWGATAFQDLKPFADGENVSSTTREALDLLRNAATEKLRDAVRNSREAEAIALIQTAGADPKALVDGDRNRSGGVTLLMEAALNNNSDTVRAILDALPEDQRAEFANQVDDKGNTALHAAYASGDEVAQKYLLDAGASKEITNLDGQRPGDPNLTKRSFLDDIFNPDVHRADRSSITVDSPNSFDFQIFDEASQKWVSVQAIRGGGGEQLVWLPANNGYDSVKFRFVDQTTGEIHDGDKFEKHVDQGPVPHSGALVQDGTTYTLTGIGPGGNGSITYHVAVDRGDAAKIHDEQYAGYDAIQGILSRYGLTSEDLATAEGNANRRFFEELGRHADGTPEKILFNLFKALSIGQQEGFKDRVDVDRIQADIAKLMTEHPELAQMKDKLIKEEIYRTAAGKSGFLPYDLDWTHGVKEWSLELGQKIKDQLLSEDALEDLRNMPPELRNQAMQEIMSTLGALDPDGVTDFKTLLMGKLLFPEDPEAFLLKRAEEGKNEGVSDEAKGEYATNVLRIVSGTGVEFGPLLAMMSPTERKAFTEALGKYLNNGGKLSDLASNGALVRDTFGSKFAGKVGDVFRTLRDVGAIPVLNSLLAVAALVEDFTGKRQTSKSAANVLNSLGDALLIIGPLFNAAKKYSGAQTDGFSKFIESLQNGFKKFGVTAVELKNKAAALLMAGQANAAGETSIEMVDNPQTRQRLTDVLNGLAPEGSAERPTYEAIVDALKKDKDLVETLKNSGLGNEDVEGLISEIAERYEAASAAPGFDARTFVNNLFAELTWAPASLVGLFRNDGALATNPLAYQQLQDRIDKIAEQVRNGVTDVDAISEALGELPAELMNALAKSKKDLIVAEIKKQVEAGVFDPETFVRDIPADSPLSELFDADGPLAEGSNARRELDTILDGIGGYAGDPAVNNAEAFERIDGISFSTEFDFTLAEDTLFGIQDEIEEAITEGTFDPKTFLQNLASDSAGKLAGNLETALLELNGVYDDEAAIARVLLDDPAIVKRIGEDGIDKLAHNIAELAKNGQFDLQTFLADADRSRNAAGEIPNVPAGSAVTQETLDTVKALQLEWLDVVAGSKPGETRITFEAFIEQKLGPASAANYRTMREGSVLPPELAVNEFTDAQAEIYANLRKTLGESIPDLAKLSFSELSGWWKTLVIGGLLPDLASILYGIGGWLSAADTIKNGKTQDDIVSGGLQYGVATSFFLWGFSSGYQWLGPFAPWAGAEAAGTLLAVVPWLGVAFGGIALILAAANYGVTHTEKYLREHAEEFLSSGIGNGQDYLTGDKRGEPPSVPPKISDQDGDNVLNTIVATYGREALIDKKFTPRARGDYDFNLSAQVPPAEGELAEHYKTLVTYYIQQDPSLSPGEAAQKAVDAVKGRMGAEFDGRDIAAVNDAIDRWYDHGGKDQLIDYAELASGKSGQTYEDRLNSICAYYQSTVDASDSDPYLDIWHVDFPSPNDAELKKRYESFFEYYFTEVNPSGTAEQAVKWASDAVYGRAPGTFEGDDFHQAVHAKMDDYLEDEKGNLEAIAQGVKDRIS